MKPALFFGSMGWLIMAGIAYLIDMGVRHSDYEETGKVNKIVAHSIDPSLMVFGSSVSQVGIDPAILAEKTNLPAYNCSINGTRFLQYKGLVDEFAAYSRNNKYVVFVETFFSFESIDALTQPENFLSEVNNENVYEALHEVQPDLVWRSRYVPFYKYTTVSYRYYKNAMIGWKRIISPSGNEDPMLGFSPVDRNWEADADEAIRNTKKFQVQIDPKIVEKYLGSIRELQAKGKKVFLVLTPMYAEMFKRITDISPVRNELIRIAGITGATFLDYSESAISDSKEYFYNSNHLNSAGASMFSSQLGDTLRSLIHRIDMAKAQ